MKLLNGLEIAGYIKERQLHQVEMLGQDHGVQPKLAIIQLKDDPAIELYIKMKKMYGADIGIWVEHHNIDQSKAIAKIKQLNDDKNIHGIIVQLPIANPDQREEILNSVSIEKDVDGLAEGSNFDPATPTAIIWLLDAYNIDYKNKGIVLIGRGTLVGAPLERMLNSSGISPTVITRSTANKEDVIKDADIIITATGQSEIVHSSIVKPNAVVIDAGVTEVNGSVVGDVAEDVRERDDVTITPKKGGVGPLTVTALFENLIRAAEKTTS